MSDTPAKPVIFISYSHKDEPKTLGPKDERWLTFVQSHLAPAVKHGIYELWVDEDIPGGGTWRADITRKLDECDVCVLLVSRHSLASDFIIDVEIETLRKRREKGEVEIFPIVLTHCAVDTAPWIREINLRPPNGQPLSDFEENERHHQMAIIAKEIAAMAQSIVKKKLVTQQKFVIGPHARRIDFSSQSTRAVSLAIHIRPKFDIGHLPETAYERLVGRDEELKRLDDAWEYDDTNVLSLIAEGGAGKSALVNEWLKRMQADNYRGAETVLGWSFYSQGTKERATSADAFLNWALQKLGVVVNSTSATAKGDAIAEALMTRRVLLVLDGVEPLQHGPDGQLGQLKDQGLRALLRRFAAAPPAEAPGLIVLTSRLAVADVAGRKDGAAPVRNIEELSEEAGAALLRDNGVWGTDKELKQASQDFGGHPLALGLLAGLLKETQNGDIRRCDHIGGIVSDDDNPRHAHAKRVMKSYETEWLADQPVLLAILQIVGLFDRPASEDCLKALRAEPVIAGLTDTIVPLDEAAWQRAIARLREVRLLSPPDPAAPGALDAHPLVREWFGARLKETNEAAWKTAHGRLYEHLRDTTKEGDTPTLEQLTPLYQAIAHGCRADRHEEALDVLFFERISFGARNYPNHVLGAGGTNLATLAWFFEKPYEAPSSKIREANKAWVLGEASYYLRAQGRSAEALTPMREALQIVEARGDWYNAARGGANLSEVELLIGNVTAAIATAERSVMMADRSLDKFEMFCERSTCAYALFMAGRDDNAELAFIDAEQRQHDYEPHNALLYSLRGHHYCDFLIAKCEFAAVRDRATHNLSAHAHHYSLLDSAREVFNLGRALLGNAIAGLVRLGDASTQLVDLQIAHARLNESVDGLRKAGTRHHIPRVLLARTILHRYIGDWDCVARDLDEVEEISTMGPMKLFLCDLTLERARLAFAMIEAFAPLNGMIEDSPPKPDVPGAERCAELRAEAASQIDIAAKLIAECGYHRRDAELAELRSVLKGERTFASLLIHV